MKARLHRALDDEARAEFTAFARDSAAASYLQDADWPDFAPRSGRMDYLWATVRGRDGRLVGTAVIRRRALGAGLWLGALRRGPVTRRPEEVGPVLAALAPVLRRAGAVSVTANPRWEDARADAAEAAMRGVGARLLPDGRQVLHRETGLIDFGRPLDEIRAGYRTEIRRQLRQLDEAGIDVVAAEAPEIQARMDRWHDATAEAKGFSISGIPDAARQIAHVRAHGGLFLAARVEGEPVGAVCALRDGDRLLLMAAGWRDPDASFPRLPLIVDAIVARAAGMEGIRALDLGGLTPEAGYEADPAARNRDRIKLRFGTRRVRLARMHAVALRPMLGALADRARSLLRGRD